MDKGSIKLRVVIADDDIRKIVFDTGLPDNIFGLVERIRDQFHLCGELKLQYMDPDFNNQFVNLNLITEIKDKDTVKVVYTSPVSSQEENEDGDTPSCSSLNTSVVSELSDNSSEDTIIIDSPPKHQPCPDEFPVPRFSYTTETKLAQGNINYQKDGTLMDTASIKSDILEKLAEEIFKYKAYPTDQHFSSVAESLIKKHPCLQEPGSFTGCYGWKISLKFKMGNFHTKLRNAGCQEICVNSLKLKQSDRFPAQNIKKPRKAEVNYLPDFPHNETETTMEAERIALLSEVNKRNNKATINSKMAKTFAQRRKEVVYEKPMANDFKDRWPALFTEKQIGAEFMRITTRPLISSFMAELDRHTAKLLTLMRAKGGAQGQKIKRVMKVLDENQNVNIPVDTRREVVLLGLCAYLNEDSALLVQEYLDSEEDEIITGEQKRTMGIFSIRHEGAGPSEMPADVGITLEGHEVINNLDSVAVAVALLFGLIYALNMNYPKNLRYFFEVIQKVFMELDGEHLTPKVQALKNKLFL